MSLLFSENKYRLKFVTFAELPQLLEAVGFIKVTGERYYAKG